MAIVSTAINGFWSLANLIIRKKWQHSRRTKCFGLEWDSIDKSNVFLVETFIFSAHGVIEPTS